VYRILSAYTRDVPKLWNDTIQAHRQEVREAVINAAATLVAEGGLRAVTMSEIAERAGIGRATLYKYFSDVESILVAWHERQIGQHLEQLHALNDEESPAPERLEAVLEAYAVIQHAQHGHELADLLHRGGHVARAHQHLRDLLRDLIAECVEGGAVRDDVTPQELASYCLHALAGAGPASSKAAVRRLVTVTMDGLRRPVE
jgi:AcrR family transcriptional regulator